MIPRKFGQQLGGALYKTLNAPANSSGKSNTQRKRALKQSTRQLGSGPLNRLPGSGGSKYAQDDAKMKAALRDSAARLMTETTPIAPVVVRLRAEECKTGDLFLRMYQLYKDNPRLDFTAEELKDGIRYCQKLVPEDGCNADLEVIEANHLFETHIGSDASKWADRHEAVSQHGPAIAQEVIDILSRFAPSMEPGKDASIVTANHIVNDTKSIVPFEPSIAHALKDGTVVRSRRVVPADIGATRQLLESLQPDSWKKRFAMADRDDTRDLAIQLVDSGIRYGTSRVVLDHEGSIIGIGDLKHIHAASLAGLLAHTGEVSATKKTCEASVLMADAYHGKGMGKQLLNQLIDDAKEKGFEQLALYVVPGNAAMLSIARSHPKRFLEASDPRSNTIKFVCQL